jgi:hypothetical protein
MMMGGDLEHQSYYLFKKVWTRVTKSC